MPRYEAGIFDPPAPILRVTVYGSGSRVAQNLPMLMDTGSDSSILPLDIADALGLPTRTEGLHGEFLSGSTIDCLVTETTVEYGHRRIRASYLVAASTYGILGLNILNSLSIVLDGSQLTWTIHASGGSTP